MRLPVLAQRRHQQLGALENSLHLQCEKLGLAWSQGGTRQCPLFVDERVDASPKLLVGDPDEAPGLHQAHTGRGVCGLQQACQYLLWNFTTRREAAHVSSFGDYAVHGAPLRRCERVIGHPAIVETSPSRTVSDAHRSENVLGWHVESQ